MSPSRDPRVDYLRVYPGLNDFSDALEAIPQSIVGYLTHLKEVEAKSGSAAPAVGEDIKSYFRERNTDKLRKISAAIDVILPAVGQKMHVAALAAEQLSHQLDRLNEDYKMICEHEVPESVQVDYYDPAFIEIVPQEKQASLRSQARREAREAREARRANQQQESRSGTPSNASETTVTTTSRRRGRTSTPQAPAYVARADNNNTASPPKDAMDEPVHSTDPNQANARANIPDMSNEVDTKRGVHASHAQDPPAPKANNGQIPPVVMPIANFNTNADDANKSSIASPSEDSGAEVIIGLKRKRGSAPKSSEPVYCYCQRGSFGEMVGCDGPHCEREWFHLDCIGLSALPKGQWFCEECRAKLRRR